MKNDYVDDSNRGTAEFNPEKGNKFDEDNLKVRNYAYHKVIIPDGTTVEGVNFTQAVPHTSAVAGKNLTFINCNLVNVEIDPTWTLTNSNNTQVRTRTITVGNQQFVVKEVEKITDNWVEVSREEIIAP